MISNIPEMRKAFFALSIIACVPQATWALDVVFSDGREHTIDDDSFFNVNVRDGLDGSPTTVNITQPGVVGGSLFVEDTSTVNVLGGTVEFFIKTLGNSNVSINGGFVRNLWLLDSSHVQAHDLTMSESFAVTTEDNAVLDIHSVNSEHIYEAQDDSVINLFSGRYKYIQGKGGDIHWHGGDLVFDVISHFGSTIAIYGTDFNYPFGRITNTLAGTLIGTLADGTSIMNAFSRSLDSTITLVYVPEPSSMIGSLLILVCLTRPRRI